VILGLLGFAGAALSTAMMFGLFWFVWWFVTGVSGLGLAQYQAWAIRFGVAMTVLIWVLGIRRHRQGAGGIDYWDSLDALLPRGLTVGADVVDYYASRVTAPAVVLSSMFVAAPRWLIEGARRFRRLIPSRQAWAEKMETLRVQLDETRRWKPLARYADVVQELQYLHWMKVAAIGLRDEILSVRISLEHQTSRDGNSD
jgi:hypothetical protein